MSEMARWSYTSVLPYRSRMAKDEWGNQAFSSEKDLICTWAVSNEAQRTADGVEFVGRHNIFTEDACIKVGDQVCINGDWQEIRARYSWDMSQFQSPNEPLDYKLVT